MSDSERVVCTVVGFAVEISEITCDLPWCFAYTHGGQADSKLTQRAVLFAKMPFRHVVRMAAHSPVQEVPDASTDRQCRESALI